jgi:hypothetical protein
MVLKRLQVLARLKPYCFSGRNIDFRPGSGVPADAGLPRLYGKHAKASQLNPIVGLEGIFHAIEDGVDCLLRFRLAHSGPLNDLIHKIEFDQGEPPLSRL